MSGKAPEMNDASRNEPKKSIELYLGYLKLEMNIMGILSAFCMAALALILKESVGGTSGSHLHIVWNDGALLICSGTILLLTAALAFYRQRSLLAYYYGWLCLLEVAPQIAEWSQHDILADADHWQTWRFYRICFACLVAAMIVDCIALLLPVLNWKLGIGPLLGCVVVVIVAVSVGFGLFERSLSK